MFLVFIIGMGSENLLILSNLSNKFIIIKFEAVAPEIIAAEDIILLVVLSKEVAVHGSVDSSTKVLPKLTAAKLLLKLLMI